MALLIIEWLITGFLAWGIMNNTIDQMAPLKMDRSDIIGYTLASVVIISFGLISFFAVICSTLDSDCEMGFLIKFWK